MKQAEFQQCWVCLRVGGVGTRGLMKFHFGLWPPVFGEWAYSPGSQWPSCGLGAGRWVRAGPVGRDVSDKRVGVALMILAGDVWGQRREQPSLLWDPGATPLGVPGPQPGLGFLTWLGLGPTSVRRAGTRLVSVQASRWCFPRAAAVRVQNLGGGRGPGGPEGLSPLPSPGVPAGSPWSHPPLPPEVQRPELPGRQDLCREGLAHCSSL